MEKIQCKNGHYYDPEKHTICPYCSLDIDDFVINIPKQTANYGNVRMDVETYGKTMPIYEEKTEVKEENVEPVVGWLVIISQDKKGKDYRILTGRNRIGKSAKNEISLSHDLSVLEDEHANIIYDPLSSKFFLSLGSGRGLAYLNEQLVMSETVIQKGDHIKIGSTEMVFVPFCTESFKW